MDNNHITTDEEVLLTFRTTFEDLKDFPDKNLIDGLTNIALNNYNLLTEMVNIVMARLINPTTSNAYKLPIFYLIDSIMKRVGGPTPSAFVEYFSEIYATALGNIMSEKDKGKLHFLLGTWLERNFFPVDLITKMKHQLQLRNNITSQQQQQQQQYSRQVHQPQLSQQFPSQMSSQQQQQQQQLLYKQQQAVRHVPSQVQYPAYHLPPAPTAATVAPISVSPPQQTGGIVDDLVKSEMVSLLQQLYAELNIGNPMSLDELATINPDLYNQILFQAQQRAEEIVRQRNFAVETAVNGGTDGDSFPQPPQLVVPVHNHYEPPAAWQYPALQQSSRYYPPAQKKRSQTNRNPNATLMGGALKYPKTAQQQRQENQSNKKRKKDNAAAAGGQQAEQFNQEQMEPAFIGEVQVYIDKERANLLQSVLSSNYNGNGAVIDENFRTAAFLSAGRMKTYLNEIDLSPQLPQILFGPLPLKPVLGAASALDDDSGGAGTGHIAKKKLPIPEFKLDELGRNPEIMVNAMYKDRPYQFHEDGLRFETLEQLKEHTDSFLEEKKRAMNATTKDARSYRDWYCRDEQWVTDFNSLSIGFDGKKGSGDAKSKSNRGGGSGNDGAAAAAAVDETEEYFLPADEHFPRCPVSREVFVQEWDDENAELIIRNAVKILVTADADENLYRLAQPIDSSSQMRYMIVHKLLVLDQWLAVGRAATVKDAIARYSSMPSSSGKLKVEQLQQAAEDEDEDDIFVLLELTS